MIQNTPASSKPEKAAGILKHFWKLVRDHKLHEDFLILKDHSWLLKERAPRLILGSPDSLPFVHAALFLDAPDLALYAIEHGAPLEDRCSAGKTALHALLDCKGLATAISKDNFGKLIPAMFEAGARCDSVSHEGYPLWFKVLAQPMPVFEKIIARGSPLDFVDKDGWPGLSLAISFGAPAEKIEFLVGKGANVNLFERSLQAAPIMAALNANNPSMAGLLVAHGANLHAKDRFKRSFLHHAQTPQAVSWLIDHGIDLEEKDVFGRTPLLHLLDRCMQKPALEFTHEEMHDVAKTMILAGADLHARDHQETSLSARSVIVSNPEKMLDLNNMLRSFEARKVAMQTMNEMCLPSP